LSDLKFLVALAPFLRSCTAVRTLGIRPTIDDYSTEEKALLRSAALVFFPTPRFAYLFDALHIPTFPCYTTYRFQHSRLLQEVLLSYVGIPHPATRIYFGTRQKAKIADTFRFPVVAMGPNAAVHHKHVVDNRAALEECTRRYNPLIIQEAVEWTERIRILCIVTECVGALRRNCLDTLSSRYEPLPLEQPALGAATTRSFVQETHSRDAESAEKLHTVLEMTRNFVRSVHLDDIVIEWGYGNGAWQLLEMTRPPVRWPMTNGILNRHHYLCELVQSGRL
jgi:hypothetical protein